MWVRADAHAAGATGRWSHWSAARDKLVPFPRNIHHVGLVRDRHHGRKVIVDTKGIAAQPAACRRSLHPARALPGVPDLPPTQPGLARHEHARIRGPDGGAGRGARPVPRARQDARHVLRIGLPDHAHGELVFVENGNCNYKSGGTFNSQSSPGVFVLARGTVTFGGGMTYYGLIYAANLQRTTGVVVISRAPPRSTARSRSTAPAGSRGQQRRERHLRRPRFRLCEGFRRAATVQGTWRELPAS